MQASRIAADLLASARLLSKEFADGAVRRDAECIIPRAEMDTVRAHGIQTARTPKAFGGPQTTAGDYARIMMDLAAGDPNVAQMLQPHFVLMDWLRVDGTDAQRARYYQDVASGHIITNAVAERGTRTPGDFETALTRDGASLRLNGTKFLLHRQPDRRTVLCPGHRRNRHHGARDHSRGPRWTHHHRRLGRYGAANNGQRHGQTRERPSR